MKKTTVALLAIVSIFTLSSCADPRESVSEKDNQYEYDLELLDGREVHCVQLWGGQSGMMSCDWENAK